MTLSEGERSLSVSLDAFQTSGPATQRARPAGIWLGIQRRRGWVGWGGAVAWQRSTTAKRQSYRPKCRLHPATADVWKHSRSPELSGKTPRSVFYSRTTAPRAARRSADPPDVDGAKQNKSDQVT